MPLVLAGATSGSTTLQATDAVTQTITLPNNTGTIITTGSSGQSIPKAALPTGSVLQIINATYSTETSTSSNAYSDTNLTLTITPQFATSKILVFVSLPISKAATDTYAGLRLVRNSTNICAFAAESGYTASSATNSGYASTSFLDSPATTSATIYKVQFASIANSSRVYAFSSNGTGTLTVMEIAA